MAQWADRPFSWRKKCSSFQADAAPGLGRHWWELDFGSSHPCSTLVQHSCVENPVDKEPEDWSPWGHRVRHDWASEHPRSRPPSCSTQTPQCRSPVWRVMVEFLCRQTRPKTLRQNDIQEASGRPMSWDPSGQRGTERDEVRLGVHWYWLYFLFVWLHHMAFEILVPPLLLEPVPPVVEAQSPNHLTAREVPWLYF